MRGVLYGFPHRPLGHLAVAAEHPYTVRDPVQVFRPVADGDHGSLGPGASPRSSAHGGKYLDRIRTVYGCSAATARWPRGRVGSIEHAAHYKLGQLICILDVNRLASAGKRCWLEIPTPTSSGRRRSGADARD